MAQRKQHPNSFCPRSVPIRLSGPGRSPEDLSPAHAHHRAFTTISCRTGIAVLSCGMLAYGVLRRRCPDGRESRTVAYLVQGLRLLPQLVWDGPLRHGLPTDPGGRDGPRAGRQGAKGAQRAATTDHAYQKALYNSYTSPPAPHRNMPPHLPPAATTTPQAAPLTNFSLSETLLTTPARERCWPGGLSAG